MTPAVVVRAPYRRENTKKRGRPATGQMPTFSIRLPPDAKKAVERWAAAQADKPGLSVAVRLIVTEHLKAKGYLK
jgi:hypothetical protein